MSRKVFRNVNGCMMKVLFLRDFMKNFREKGHCLSKWLVLSFVFLGINVAFASMKIIVVSHGQAPDNFWNVVRNGVRSAEDDFRRSVGLKVYYRSPASFDMEEMVRLLEKAIAEKPDGLVVSIPVVKSLKPSIRKAIKAGIPVVSMNSGYAVYKDLGISVHVGQDDFMAGVKAGKRWKSLGVRRVAVINHEPKNNAFVARVKGLKKELGSKIKEVIVSGAFSDIKKEVQKRLEKDKKIDAVMGLSVRSAEPVMEVLEEKFKKRAIKLASFDLSGKLLEGVKEKKVAFLVDQSPYMQGYLPIAVLVQLVRYGRMSLGGSLITGAGIVALKDSPYEITSDFIKLSKKEYR